MNTVTIDASTLRKILWVGIIVLILAAGVGAAVLLIKLGPKAPKTPPEVVLTEVEVMTVRRETVPVEFTAQGDVEAVLNTQLVAQVGGQVVEVSPRLEAGESIAAQEFLLQIDRTDYEAALASAEAALEDSKLALLLEEANAERAQRDWEKLGQGREASALVLREPQLASAKAKVVAAQSSVDKALADLDRTRVVAPYACRIQAKYLDLGATVAPGTRLVDIVSLGAVEVRLPLSLEDYGFLKRDEKGNPTGEVRAQARIGGAPMVWNGQLVRSEELVDPSTRSINVVVRFEGEERPPPGLFVNATVQGRSLEGRVVLPREALLDAGHVLLVTEESTLEFREVDVERTEADEVVIRGGLKEGERVCLTPLSTPVNGMKVTVNDGTRAAAESLEDTNL